MSETARITSKNQITLPANVRSSLGVHTGDTARSPQFSELQR